MYADLEGMSRDQLVGEVKRLRQGIRDHRDSTGHELGWHHPALWSLLPERSDPLPVVPTWPQFLRGCVRFATGRSVQRGLIMQRDFPSPEDIALRSLKKPHFPPIFSWDPGLAREARHDRGHSNGILDPLHLRERRQD